MFRYPKYFVKIIRNKGEDEMFYFMDEARQLHFANVMRESFVKNPHSRDKIVLGQYSSSQEETAKL
jgi:hypothetical protein